MRDRGQALLSWILLFLLTAVAGQSLWSEWSRARYPERDDDWDNQLLLAEAQREALLDYGEAPLWNMYPEGGTPLLANPESSIAYPLTWLTLPLPTQQALKLQLLLHLLIGVAGTYALGRRLGLSPAPAAYGAAVYMFASIFPERVRTGHLMWMAMSWLPWAVCAALRWSRPDRLITGAILALQWLQGGHYLLLFTLSAVICIRCTEVLRSDRLLLGTLLLLCTSILVAPHLPLSWRAALLLLPLIPPLVYRPRVVLAEGQHLLLVLAIFAGLAAIKLLPTLELWSFSPRFSALESTLPPGDGLWQSWARWAGLLSRDSIEVHEDQPTLHHVLPMLFGVAGAFVARRELRPLLVVFGLGWMWSLGSRAPLPVSALMEGIPAFSLVRYSARSAVLPFLTLSVAAAFGLSALKDLLGRVKSQQLRVAGMVVLYGIGAASASWMALQSRDTYAGVFNGPMPPEKVTRSEFVRLQCETSMYMAFLENRGCVNGFSAVPLVNARNVRSLGEGAYLGEAYLEGAEGTVSIKARTATGLTLEVKTAGPGGRAVINQSFFPGWRIRGDGSAESWQGLLSVPAVERSSLMTLEYKDRFSRVGAALSISALVFVAARLRAHWRT